MGNAPSSGVRLKRDCRRWSSCREQPPTGLFCRSGVLRTPQVGTRMIWSPKPASRSHLPRGPLEMKAMWNATAAPRLLQHGGSTGAFSSRVLRFTGVGESTLAEQVTDLLDNDNPTVAPYAFSVTSRCVSRLKATASQAEDLLDPLEQELLRRQARPVTAGMDSLASVVLELLRHSVKRWPSRNLHRWCPGGRLHGSARHPNGFAGGVIAYSRIKSKFCMSLLSFSIVMERSPMRSWCNAEGVRDQFGCDWGIAISGVAKPWRGNAGQAGGVGAPRRCGPRWHRGCAGALWRSPGQAAIQQLSVIRA